MTQIDRIKLTEKVDAVIVKMNRALDEMHKALIEKCYDNFEKADIEFCEIWDKEVTDKMLFDNTSEKRIYHCIKKFYVYRKAW